VNKSIEISIDTAKELLPCLESQFQHAEDQANDWANRANHLKASIAELRAKMNGSELPLANGEYRKRLQKGRGGDIIYELFKSLPEGTGLTTAQIKEKTGLKHATVYRTLNEPKRNAGRFRSEDNLWKLIVRYKRVAESVAA